MTERQELILQMFAEDKSMSRERICEKTGLSDGTIKREIAFLKKSGYLERIGSLKYFLFRLQKNYAQHTGFPPDPTRGSGKARQVICNHPTHYVDFD